MDFSFSMLADGVIVLGILLISLVLTLTGTLINNVTFKLRIVNISNIVVLVHIASNGLIYYSHGKYLYCFAPIFSIYGPLFYFHIKLLTESSLSKRMVLLHLIPVILISATKILFVLIKADIENFYFLLGLEGLSLLSYGVYGFFLRLDKRLNIFNNAFNASGIVFMICGAFTLLNVSSALNRGAIVNGRVAYLNLAYYAIWLLMNLSYNIACILILTKYRHILPKSLLRSVHIDDKQYAQPNTVGFSLHDENIATVDERYKSCKLSAEVRGKYAQELAVLMQQKQVFLNSELTLSKLAGMLKLSDYHLSQVLSIELEGNFYGYINKLRIEHAIGLMDQGTKLNLEQIMIESGFNNRVSFNRYFKQMKNMQPSVYLKLLRRKPIYNI